MLAGRGGAPSRRGRSEDQPVRSSAPILTLRDEGASGIHPSCLTGPPDGFWVRSLSVFFAIPSVDVVRVHPRLRDDRRPQRQLAAEHGGGDDLGELAHIAVAVAAQQLQASASAALPP